MGSMTIQEWSIPMYYGSGEAVLALIGIGADLSVCQRLDEP